MGRFSCLGIPKPAFEESAHRHRRTPAATGHRDLDYDLRTIVRMVQSSMERIIIHCH